MGIRFCLLAASLMCVAGCSKTIDAETIGTEIQQAIIKQGGNSLKTATCPKNIPIAGGTTFDCIAELDSGDAFVIPVKQTNAIGKVEWQVPNAKGLLNLAALETVFQQTIQTDERRTLAIDCGAGYRAVRPGESFECKVKPLIANSTKSGKAPTQKVQPAKPTQNPGKTKSTQSTSLPQAILVTIDPESNVNWRQVMATTIADSGPKGASTSNSSQQTWPPPPALAPTGPSVRANLSKDGQKDVEQRFD